MFPYLIKYFKTQSHYARFVFSLSATAQNLMMLNTVVIDVVIVCFFFVKCFWF